MKTKKVLFLVFASILGCGAAMPIAAQSAPGFPKDQAGLTAYAKLDEVSQTEFDNARNNLFDYVEAATSTYMIGVKSYFINDKTNDDGYNKIKVHIYLGADGWLAVYLLKGESLGKIVNWSAGSLLTDTLLKTSLDEARLKIGVVAVEPPHYYDFSRIQASKMALINDTIGAAEAGYGDEFSVLIPGKLEQASYSLASFGCVPASWYKLMSLYLNGSYAAGEYDRDLLWGDFNLANFKTGESNAIWLEMKYGSSCGAGATTVLLYDPY
jgi:hypothetical protein